MEPEQSSSTSASTNPSGPVSVSASVSDDRDEQLLLSHHAAASSSLRYSAVHPVYVDGWLSKEGKSLRSRRLRYLRLNSHILSSHRNKTSPPSWQISVADAIVERGTHSREIKISLPHRSISLIAPSHQAFHSWIIALRRASVVSSHVDDYYTIGRLIGEGMNGRVRLAHDMLTKETVAIKMVPRHGRENETQFLAREVQIILSVNHPNIVNTIDIFVTRRRIHFVMEYLVGGELFDFIAENSHFSESHAATVMTDLLNALSYLHSRGIAHRDVKLENLLCANTTWPLHVKLADFGFANYVNSGNEPMLSSFVGTPNYIAPEMLRADPHGRPVDIWAGGVVLYILLSGKFPFGGNSESEYYQCVLGKEAYFPIQEWANISEDAKDLVRGMLCKDPKNRLTADQCLRHRWFKRSQQRLGYGVPDLPQEIVEDEDDEVGVEIDDDETESFPQDTNTPPNIINSIHSKNNNFNNTTNSNSTQQMPTLSWRDMNLPSPRMFRTNREKRGRWRHIGLLNQSLPHPLQNTPTQGSSSTPRHSDHVTTSDSTQQDSSGVGVMTGTNRKRRNHININLKPSNKDSTNNANHTTTTSNNNNNYINNNHNHNNSNNLNHSSTSNNNNNKNFPIGRRDDTKHSKASGDQRANSSSAPGVEEAAVNRRPSLIRRLLSSGKLSLDRYEGRFPSFRCSTASNTATAAASNNGTNSSVGNNHKSSNNGHSNNGNGVEESDEASATPRKTMSLFAKDGPLRRSFHRVGERVVEHSRTNPSFTSSAPLDPGIHFVNSQSQRLPPKVARERQRMQKQQAEANRRAARAGAGGGGGGGGGGSAGGLFGSSWLGNSVGGGGGFGNSSFRRSHRRNGSKLADGAGTNININNNVKTNNVAEISNSAHYLPQNSHRQNQEQQQQQQQQQQPHSIDSSSLQKQSSQHQHENNQERANQNLNHHFQYEYQHTNQQHQQEKQHLNQNQQYSRQPQHHLHNDTTGFHSSPRLYVPSLNMLQHRRPIGGRPTGGNTDNPARRQRWRNVETNSSYTSQSLKERLETEELDLRQSIGNNPIASEGNNGENVVRRTVSADVGLTRQKNETNTNDNVNNVQRNVVKEDVFARIGDEFYANATGTMEEIELVRAQNDVRSSVC